MRHASLHRAVAELKRINEKRRAKIWAQAQDVFLTPDEQGKVRVLEAYAAIGNPPSAEELAWYTDLKNHAINEFLYRTSNGVGIILPLLVPVGTEPPKPPSGNDRWTYLNPQPVRPFDPNNLPRFKLRRSS